MIPRSYLFVPADSEKKLAKGADSGADALLLDLEDAVSAVRKPVAREMARAYLDARPLPRQQEIWIRINDLHSGFALDDLAAVVGGKPDGLMIPKTNSGVDVTLISHYLDILEVRDGVPPGHIKLMVVSTETAEAIFNLGTYKGSSKRLTGLSWGAEDLATSLGASSNKGPDGLLLPIYQLARSLCVAGAQTAGVTAYDTAFINFKDPEGLKATMAAARRDGYRGALAIHPDQVAVINEAFTPSEAEVAWARRVIAAFDAEPGAGVVSLEGKMLDRPHQRQAEAVLALYESIKARG